ncbi:hypothetical protein E2542_SST28672 [Spatholobus suberectus]|nr:hypothetical protein E2542_SST28672 [Spatholobus suberectus]
MEAVVRQEDNRHRCRNLSCGSRSITLENFSVKQLLLRSKSKRSLRRLNLCGTVPQVGVDVEPRKVDEQAKLLEEVSGNVAMVEIDSGDNADLRIIRL